MLELFLRFVSHGINRALKIDAMLRLWKVQPMMIVLYLSELYLLSLAESPVLPEEQTDLAACVHRSRTSPRAGVTKLR